MRDLVHPSIAAWPDWGQFVGGPTNCPQHMLLALMIFPSHLVSNEHNLYHFPHLLPLGFLYPVLLMLLVLLLQPVTS